MVKFILAALSCFSISAASFAQDDFKLTGMPSLAFNSGNSSINFGGPSVKTERGDYFAGLSFFPSLRHNGSADEWTPILGAGVFAGCKKVFLVIPSYYYASNWYTALGLGYKF